jgi:hypothetical protein
VEKALKTFAHELAEKQRAWAREPRLPVRIDHSQLPFIVEAAVDLAADLIDPEVKR